jgi:hypothetical protein
MASESGSVCPNGHGMVKPPMPEEVRRRNHAMIAHPGIRDVKHGLSGGRVMLPDDPVKYDVVEKLGGRRGEKIPAGFLPGDKIALDGEKVLWLRPEKPCGE